MDPATRSAVADARNSARTHARSLMGARLRELMTQRNVSNPRALAARSGLGVGTVHNLLNGTSEPTLSTMLALVRSLELGSIEELIAPLGTAVALGRYDTPLRIETAEAVPASAPPERTGHGSTEPSSRAN